MKVPKRLYDHIFYIHLPIIAISLALIFFCKNQIILTFKAHWLILFLALLLIFLPVGSYRLGKANESPRLKWPVWLSLIFMLQISAYLLFYLFCYVLDVNAIKPPVDIMKILYWNWGLFPWGMYALVAISLAFISFREQKIGMISIALQPLFKNTIDDAVGVSGDSYARVSIIFSLCSTLSFICLALIIFVAKTYGFPIVSGLKISTMLFVSSLISIIYLPEYQKWMYRILSYNLPLILVIPAFILLLAIVVLFFALLFHFASAYLPLLNFQTPLFSDKNIRPYFIIYSGVWWIIWTPLLAASMAYISQGYRIRTVVMGILALPVLISFAIGMHWNLSVMHSPWAGLILAGLSLIILFSFFLRKKNLTYLMRVVLPKSQTIKPRSPIHYLRNLLQFIVLLVLAYLIGGISLLSIFSFLAGLPTGIVMIYVCVSLYKKIMGKKNPP
jgi:glycine betaine transporter